MPPAAARLTMTRSTDLYDVIILGSGIGGTILGCILAKQGLRTLIIEELSHPRFTIGESLIPETGIRLQILSEKFGIPEIGWVGNFNQLKDNVSAACGVKRSFTFAYHREGQAQDVAESNQLPTLTPPFGPDAHLFRQDTDAFLAVAAVRYGARLIQQIKVKGVEFLEDEVGVEMVNGERHRCRLLIDAGGMRSHVATQLGLRDKIPNFETDTRVTFNHFIGVKPYDLVVGPDHPLPSAYGQSTLHHIFDGGWIWIIPFNNHRDATNPLTSVGLVLDRRKHPEFEGSPEEEFWAHIRRFPSIAQHFATAEAIRPWVRSGRIQFSSGHMIGPGFIQLPHAAAFIDPLFSSGMSVLTVALDIMAESILKAFKDNDLSVERFQQVEDFTLASLAHYDRVIARSFDSFGDYGLWNAWNRVWMVGNYLGTWGSLRMLLKWYETGDRKWLDMSTERARTGVLGSQLPEIRELISSSSDDVLAAQAGEITSAEASDRIFKRIAAARSLPPFLRLGDEADRTLGTFALMSGARQLLWYRFSAPPEWRDYASFNIFTYLRKVAGFLGKTGGAGLGRTWRGMRDVVFSRNRDWMYKPNALAVGSPRYTDDEAGVASSRNDRRGVGAAGPGPAEVLPAPPTAAGDAEKRAASVG